MGAAQEHLTASERETIARDILTEPLPHLVSGRVSAHCPFHAERTAGGAFFYDPEEDIGHCHSCGESADLIGLYNVVAGNDVADPRGFKAFFETYAPERLADIARKDTRITCTQREWHPKNATPSPALWIEKANGFIAKRVEYLQNNQQALGLLHSFGITRKTAKLCRLGWYNEDRFYKYTAWGLPYAENDNGRERCIFAPRGLVLPCYQRGELQRIKIRVHEPEKGQPKYRALEGGNAVYGVWGNPQCRVWIVVETERDAILCWQELNAYGIGAMASGSASIAPDAYAHALLYRADCVINAMDNDHAGAKRSWSFHERTSTFAFSNYAHAVRWLVPSSIGKDVGDLPSAGIRVWDWLRLGLPQHIRLYCERHAQHHAAQPQCFDLPPMQRIEQQLTPLSYDAYAEILGAAQAYGLCIERRGTELRFIYAEGQTPHKDADFYVQNILDNIAYTDLKTALLEALTNG